MSAIIVVEERLGRLKALVLAMESVAMRGGDLPGDIGDTCGWLQIMAHDELEKIKASLGPDVLKRDAA